MRQLIALAAATLTAPALALTAPATAPIAAATAKPAPAGPVEALRQQFAQQGNVRIAEEQQMLVDGDVLLRQRTTGALRFGKSGVDACDTTMVAEADKKGSPTIRMIMIDGKTYLKSTLYDELLPAGKSWVRSGEPTGNPSGNMIDILRPQVLKAVLTTTKSKRTGGKVDGTRTTLLSGSITVGDLEKVSPDLGMIVKLFKVKKTVTLPWKLWIGGDQLPRRFTSTFALSGGADISISTSTRLTAWGKKVTIKAPPADLVIDEKDLETDLPETPDPTRIIKGLKPGNK